MTAAFRRFAPSLAIGLVAFVDAVVLAGAAWNRGGEPEAVLTITERELRIAATWKENSGIWLRLDWNRFEVGTCDDQETVFKSPERIQDLGFDTSVPPDHPEAEVVYGKALPLERYAVLEFEGESWACWLRAQEQSIEEMAAKVARGEEAPRSLDFARQSLDADREARSRLTVIDLGRDPQELRRRYPDRGRFLVTRAVVALFLESRWDSELHRQADFHLKVRVREIVSDELQVPRPLRAVPEAARRRAAEAEPDKVWQYQGRTGPPQYEVEMRYGRRLDPWIASIRELPEPPKGVTPDR